MRKVRNAGAFALMFAASLLLVLSGCQGPMAPDMDGTGTVSLRIESPDFARAITPGIVLGDFDDFGIAFTHATLGSFEPAWARDPTTGDVTSQVSLPVGNNWSVTVTAYIYDAEDGYIEVARGTTTVNVTGTGIVPLTVLLLPFTTENDEGVFSWALEFPGNVIADEFSRIDIFGDDGSLVETVPLPDNADGEWEDGVDLYAGEYFVRIMLTNDEGYMVIMVMDLHVYGNLTSHFEWEFIEEDFADIEFVDTMALAAAIYSADALLYATVERADLAAAANVPVGTYWATPAVRDTFGTAIEAARAVLNDANATQADVDEAYEDLADARETFEEEKTEGTYDPTGGAPVVATLGDFITFSGELSLTPDWASTTITTGTAFTNVAPLTTSGDAYFDWVDNDGELSLRVSGITAQADGINLIATALGGFEDRDVITVMVRYYTIESVAAGGRQMMLRSLGADWDAMHELSIPGTFEGLREDPIALPGAINTASRINADARVHTNTHGGVAQGNISRFYIDGIDIYRPEPPAGTNQQLFALVDYVTTHSITANSQAPNNNTPSEAAHAAAGFRTDWNPRADWIEGPGPTLSLQQATRTQNHHRMEIVVNNLGFAVQSGDTITITGRASVTPVTGSGAGRRLDIGSAQVSVPVDTDGEINFSETFTIEADDVIEINNAGWNIEPAVYAAGINTIIIDNVVVMGYR